ncbi:MAG: hydantoinase [Rhodospirillaceae bacterium]|nr:hydantoinase [Rhodospirillaceae bacterium]|tara:strand:+ start:184 stop:1812 length:1629 start_codon:yes stop_codon:yes gene_type:complete
MLNEATNSANASFDPITLEVLWTRLISTVDEAAAALVRTSFSTVVRDSHDFSCVITDASGRSLVQATDSIPSFIATLPATIKHFLDVYPADQLEPGDVLITNDIWMGTGHLPDISVGKPIFRNDKLVGFAGSTAHAPDIGGKIRSPEPREVFEEGFQIPIMKLIKAGEVDETFMRLLRQNVRAPDEVVGDLYAQLTALDLMERRVSDVMTQYELADLATLASEIQDRSEKAMRAAIRELPDGTYTNEMPTDGLDVPVTLKVAVTIDGDEVRADYTGSSPQVGKAINCAMCYTYAMTAYAVKCAAAPDLPNNEGSVAPISAFAPERTIVNPLFPASGGSRALIGHFLPALIFGALAQVVPDRIMAGTGSPLWCINLAGVKPNGKPFANLFFFNGGMGATHRTDGQNCLSWPSNISSTPTEVIEQLSPMRIHRRGFRADSGGKGRYRGGLGQEVEFEFLNETPAALAMLAERTKTSAPGIAGGEAGALGKLEINGVDVDPKAQHIVKQGDRLVLATPGGGGYGNVVDRDDSDAARDKSLGYAGE